MILLLINYILFKFNIEIIIYKINNNVLKLIFGDNVIQCVQIKLEGY